MDNMPLVEQLPPPWQLVAFKGKGWVSAKVDIKPGAIDGRKIQKITGVTPSKLTPEQFKWIVDA